jgi:membrane protein
MSNLSLGDGSQSREGQPVEPGWWPLIKQAGTQWVGHKDARLGAALAYYSVFSIGPLIVIAVAIAGLLFEHDAVRGEVSNGLRGLLGDTGAKAIEGMLASAGKPREGILATIIGIGTLVFAAIGVVVQLKDALNTVWDVKTSPGRGIWGFVRAYVLSFAGVLALGFLLLVSMLVTTALAAAGKYLAPYLPETAFQALSFIVSFLVITLLFAMMFKWLPDAEVRWRDVWLGAAVTAALFELGKFLIGLYIGKQGLESTYGAAASIVIVLIWVYYSAQIVLFGAEFTNARAKQVAGVEPRRNHAGRAVHQRRTA